MTDEIKDICALCKHFKMKAHPEHAKVGIGRCHGYDNDPAVKIKNPFTPWGTKKCTRYAQDYAGTEKRVAWVKAKLAQQNNEAVQPDLKEHDGKRHQRASDITRRS